jgi:hypothetical protein
VGLEPCLNVCTAGSSLMGVMHLDRVWIAPSCQHRFSLSLEFLLNCSKDCSFLLQSHFLNFVNYIFV